MSINSQKSHHSKNGLPLSQEVQELVDLCRVMVNNIKNGTQAEWYVLDTKKVINDAKNKGADVSNLESQMPELEKQAARKWALMMVNNIKKNGDLSQTVDYISATKKAINDAKNKGADVSDLESQMPELEKEAARRWALMMVNNIKNARARSQSYLNDTKKAIDFAKRKGSEVSDLEKEVQELEKLCVQ